MSVAGEETAVPEGSSDIDVGQFFDEYLVLRVSTTGLVGGEVTRHGCLLEVVLFVFCDKLVILTWWSFLEP